MARGMIQNDFTSTVLEMSGRLGRRLRFLFLLPFVFLDRDGDGWVDGGRYVWAGSRGGWSSVSSSRGLLFSPRVSFPRHSERASISRVLDLFIPPSLFL